MFRAFLCLFVVCIMGTLPARHLVVKEVSNLTTKVKQKKYWRCCECNQYYQQEEQPDVCTNCGSHSFYFFYL